MRTLTRFFLTAVLGGLSLILVACGGGGGSSSSSGGSASGSSVKLSGVVATGAVAASSTPSGVVIAGGATTTPADCTNLASTGTVLANAIVIAVDDKGNTYTASAAADGSFSLNAPSGDNYALVFIDPHTLKVIGSLVQAAGGATVGAIPLSGNTSMGRIVINGSTGQAFAQADACGTVPTADGSTTFTSDPSTGTINSDDITSMQSSTISGSGGTTGLSNISVVNFMGDPDTWHTSIENGSGQTIDQGPDCTTSSQMDTVTADYLQREFTVERAVTVPGPDGNNVAATKEATIPYFISLSNVTISPSSGDLSCWQNNGSYSSSSGYLDETSLENNINIVKNGATTSWIMPYNNVSALSPDPANLPLPYTTTDFNFNYGINGWGQYRYVDTTAGKIIFGEKEVDANGNISINWNQMALPLNFAPGTPASMTEDTNGDGTADTTQSCTVVFAQNPDGSAAIVTDTNNLKLPVVKVSCTDTPIAGTTGGRSGTQSFYILAKYGAQAPTSDPSGNLTWDQSLSKYVRFGTLTRDSTGAITAIAETTPSTIGATTGNDSPMPDTALAGTATSTIRDGWLTYLDSNSEKVDVYTGGSGGSDYFWVKYDQATGQAATPVSWDPTTQTNTPLTGSSTPVFSVTELHYGIASSSKTYTFKCQFRGWMPNSATSTTGTMVDVGPAVIATDASSNSLTTLGQTTNEVVDQGVLCPGLTVPTVPAINTATGTSGWYDWDSSTGKYDIPANSVELDLEMMDNAGNVFQQQSVNYYTVH